MGIADGNSTISLILTEIKLTSFSTPRLKDLPNGYDAIFIEEIPQTVCNLTKCFLNIFKRLLPLLTFLLLINSTKDLELW